MLLCGKRMRSCVVGFLFLFVSVATAQAEDIATIGALGTLLPESGLVRVVGTPGTSISQINIKQDETVEHNATIARLSNHELLEAELKSIRLEYDILLTVHKHKVNLLQLAVDNARLRRNRADASLNKYLALSKNAQVNAVRDQRRNDVADARHALKTKEAELAQAIDTIELDKKKIQLQIEKAQINLNSADVKAPFSGLVLDVPGVVGGPSGAGIVVLADISQMMVKCEVYEGDLGKVKVGQKATASGKSLSKDISGQVVKVGREIDISRKVAIVWVRLDDSIEAGKLIGMEVNVSIQH